MFSAMNRFRVAKGSEAAFEQVWMSRDSHLERASAARSRLLAIVRARDHPS
jgi:heme-degrading monooxygenase HmoA